MWDLFIAEAVPRARFQQTGVALDLSELFVVVFETHVAIRRLLRWDFHNLDCFLGGRCLKRFIRRDLFLLLFFLDVDLFRYDERGNLCYLLVVHQAFKVGDRVHHKHFAEGVLRPDFDFLGGQVQAQ